MHKSLIIGTWCILLSTSAMAHGGHTAIESNLWHYLFSPEHLLLAVVGLIIVSMAVWYKKIVRGVVRISSRMNKQK